MDSIRETGDGQLKKLRAEEETAIECFASDTRVAVGEPQIRICF